MDGRIKSLKVEVRLDPRYTLVIIKWLDLGKKCLVILKERKPKEIALLKFEKSIDRHLMKENKVNIE